MDADYVCGGTLTARPVCPARLDDLVLSRLPSPCLITINERDYPCETSTVELEFDQPGKYHIVVQAWPYLDKEFTIENPA